jgi:ABC-type dipeptide/oligopeptide/nickel transport system permease subunit
VNAKLRAGLGLAAGIAAFAVLGPFVVQADPDQQSLAAALTPPGEAYWLGADHVGRSLLARLAHGAWRSLGLAIFCVAAAGAVGVLAGLASAWRGGWVEIAVMRGADLVMAFPGLLLALLLAGLLGGGAGPLALGLTISQWPQFARVTRAAAASALTRPHVEAAALAGHSGWFILTRHVLPPLLPQIAAIASLSVGTAVLSIASLGFLGIGLQAPTAEWGAMVNETLPYHEEAPLLVWAPSLAIFVSVLALHLLGEGLSREFAR